MDPNQLASWLRSAVCLPGKRQPKEGDADDDGPPPTLGLQRDMQASPDGGLPPVPLPVGHQEQEQLPMSTPRLSVSSHFDDDNLTPPPLDLDGNNSKRSGAPTPRSNSSLPLPASPSPLHHRRNSSSSQSKYKETLNAFAGTDSSNGTRFVNQYLLNGFIGQGSYATVEEVLDRENNQKYACKEFSKARLRKRATADSRLRRPRGRAPPGRGAPPPPPEAKPDFEDNISLIRSEIAIMKKLNHDHLCKIREVIDVTSEDSLFVIMELLEGGPIIQVSAGKKAEPKTEEEARSIIRQMMLALDYLHTNQIVHRDIKPDNVLFAADGKTVKLCDFGVSLMFSPTSKAEAGGRNTVGSPAFLSPEATLGQGSDGFPLDLWAMGVTLYCLVLGKLPYEEEGVLVLYQSIREKDLKIPHFKLSKGLRNVLERLLDKDPSTRATLKELWTDDWITQDGTDPLLSHEDNTMEEVQDPTPEEMDNALRNLRSSIIAAAFGNKLKRQAIARRTASSSSSLPDNEARRQSVPDLVFSDEPKSIDAPTSPRLDGT